MKAGQPLGKNSALGVSEDKMIQRRRPPLSDRRGSRIGRGDNRYRTRSQNNNNQGESQEYTMSNSGAAGTESKA